jgi:ATP-dependent protease HslVU (ClpYQ) peptidase subunit
MSTVVVVNKRGLACIGADTLTCFGSMKQLGRYKSDPEKVFRIGESYFGVIGSTAHRMVLESALSGGDPPRLSNRHEIFHCFRSLHPRLKSEYFLLPKEDEKDPYESSQMDLLIANRHGIFGLMSLREVYEYSRFWAIGSGSDYALGAMHAAYDQDLTARLIAEIGLNAACEFDDGTAAPFTIITIEVDLPRGNDRRV